jgi:hypothetical protein
MGVDEPGKLFHLIGMKASDANEMDTLLNALRKAHLRRVEAYGEAISDQQFLRRREQGCLALLMLLAGWLTLWGLPGWFESGEFVLPLRIFTSLMLLAFFYLGFVAYRTRKILEVFERFSPQNMQDIEPLLAADSNRHNPP